MRRFEHDEDGFTLVFFALTVVVILMFVAMAVDLGAGFDERRQDVSAADGAALAAAQQVGDTAKRDTAIQVAEANVGVTGLDWNSCDGTNALAVEAPSANCITFDLTRSLVRVEIPTRSLSYFGNAAGLPDVTHSASAIARASTEGFGGILPFALNIDGAGHQCVRYDSGGNTACSTGATAGNYGEADFSVFEEECANVGDTKDRMQFNISHGVDHELAIRGIDVQRIDQNVCNDTIAGPANSVNKATGLTQQLFGDAVMHGGTVPWESYTGRLARAISGWWGNDSDHRITISGSNIDNIGLWEYIEASSNSSSAIPTACRLNQFEDESGVDDSIQGNGTNLGAAGVYIQATYPTDAEQMTVALERCFAHFMAGGVWNDDFNDDGTNDFTDTRVGCTGVALADECTSPVFTRHDGLDSLGLETAKIDMQLSPRFGYTPRLTGTEWVGASPRDIVRFRAVYLYRVCGDRCSGSGGNVYQHDPGFNITGSPAGNKVGDLTAFVFPDNMLPFGLASPGAPFDLDLNRFVELIR